MNDKTSPPAAPRIVIHSTRELSEGETIEVLVDATAEKVAGALVAWADRAIAAGQPLTSAQVDQFVENVKLRLRNSLGNALGRRRGSPGVTMLDAIFKTRDETRAAAPRTPVLVPEYQEVETEAVYDAAGKMTGTRTIKQAVRQ